MSGSKIIPILPCASIDEQCEFYENLGFVTTAKYVSPSAYAVTKYDDIELHFWGNKKHIPEENATVLFVRVDDVYAINDIFSRNIKKAAGNIPRRGIPRITKVRELKEDARFTLTDTGGNTLYFGTPNNGEAVDGRTLESEKHAKAFAVIYDLLHSHESPEKALKASSVFMKYKNELNESDRAKFEKLTAEIENALKEKD